MLLPGGLELAHESKTQAFLIFDASELDIMGVSPNFLDAGILFRTLVNCQNRGEAAYLQESKL